MTSVMFCRDRKTGDWWAWNFTGQAPESMIAEAKGYSKHTEHDYVLFQTDDPTQTPKNPFAFIPHDQSI